MIVVIVIVIGAVMVVLVNDTAAKRRHSDDGQDELPHSLRPLMAGNDAGADIQEVEVRSRQNFGATMVVSRRLRRFSLSIAHQHQEQN